MKKQTIIFIFFSVTILASIIFGLSKQGFGTKDPFVFKYTYGQGDIRTYDLEEILNIQFKTQNNQESLQTIQFTGQYVEKVYEVAKGHILLGAKLINVKFNSNFDINDDPRYKGLLKAFEKEIFIEIHPSRKVKQFYFINEENIEASNFIKNVFLSTQLILNETQDENTYTKQSFEVNMSGRYESHYDLKKVQSDQFEIEKKIIRYGIDEEGNLDESADIEVVPGSMAQYLVDRQNGLINKVTYKEENRIQSFGMKINNNLQINLELSSVTNDSSLKMTLAKLNSVEYFKSGIQGGKTSPKKEKELLKKRTKGYQLDDVLKEIRDLNFATNGPRAYELFRILSALLQINPKEIDNVLKEVENLDPQEKNYSDFVSIAFGAISSMNAKDAQGPLMDYIQNNIQNIPLMEQAFAAFGDLESPNQLGKSFLTELLERPINPEIESLASLSLGGLGYKAKADDNDKLQNLTAQYLLERLENSKSIMTTLSSLGNTGSELVIEKIGPYLESKDSTIRMGAVGTLDNVEVKHSRAIIKKVFNLEKDYDVRSSAYDVVGRWPPSRSKLNMAKNLYEKESDKRLKIRALNVVAQNSKYFKEEVKEILNKVKDGASDQEVKDAAIDLMLSF